MKLTKKLLKGHNVHVTDTHVTNGHWLILRSRVENPGILSSPEALAETMGCTVPDRPLPPESVASVLAGVKDSTRQYLRTDILTDLEGCKGSMRRMFRDPDTGAVAFFGLEVLAACDDPAILMGKDDKSAFYISNEECLMPFTAALPPWLVSKPDGAEAAA